MDEQRLLDVALAAARNATEVHRRRIGRIEEADWSLKGSADFVSAADHEAEQRVVDRISGQFPDHAILAEERPNDMDAARAAEWVWIIDPLDGTTNFLHAFPAYAASVAVARRGRVIAGAVVSGATGEAWTAVRGSGAYLNGERIHVSGTSELSHALIGTGFPFKAQELMERYTSQLTMILHRTAGIRRTGSAALDLCYVAAGWLDGFWELTLAPWDIAAGTLFIREAGGVLTRIEGGGEDDVRPLDHGSVLAGNPEIHRKLGEILSEDNE